MSFDIMPIAGRSFAQRTRLVPLALRVLGRSWLMLCLFLSVVFAYRAINSSGMSTLPRLKAANPHEIGVASKAISRLRVGDRVLTNQMHANAPF